MNFVFISPNFPHTYWQFCDRLVKNGATVLGIGDAPYDELEQPLKCSLKEYYKVNSLENYDEVKGAVQFFASKYGKIDWIESNNEYWLEQDAKLRTEFSITTGVQAQDIYLWKQKSKMHEIYNNAGVPVALQHKVSTLEAAKDFITVVGFPVIVKPDIGVGAADTWKITNQTELKNFYNNLPNVPYVMEQFITGDICSYDVIANSNCEPLFECMTIWPPSIADIVNKGLDLAYYTTSQIPDNLKTLGRKTLKAFNVKSRFAHLEFFRLKKRYDGLGDIGDFVALEVNMRPAGGYTPDMMDYADSTDVYQIWADMVTADKRLLPDIPDKKFCVYASRKNQYNYVYPHYEVINKYVENIVMCEKMPPLMWETMGCQMYTACFKDKNEVDEFIEYIHKKCN